MFILTSHELVYSVSQKSYILTLYAQIIFYVAFSIAGLGTHAFQNEQDYNSMMSWALRLILLMLMVKEIVYLVKGWKEKKPIWKLMLCEVVATVLAVRLFFQEPTFLTNYFEGLVSLLNMRFAF